MVVLAVLPFQMWKNLLLLLTEKRITGIHLPERSPNPEDHPLKSHCCLAASFRSLFSHTHFFLTFIADCFSFHLPSSLSNISNQITDRLALVPLYFFYCSQTHRTVFFFLDSLLASSHSHTEHLVTCAGGSADDTRRRSIQKKKWFTKLPPLLAACFHPLSDRLPFAHLSTKIFHFFI